MPTSLPIQFHVTAKPSGSACNLNCAYCYFLKKAELYPGSPFRMPEEVHEAYIRQLLDSHTTAQVTVAWQGGEPTLMGLDFFARSIDLQRRYARPGVQIENTFQTNGLLIDEDWCRFFRQHRFLVGLSLDGPEDLHDHYRRDHGGHGTFARVVRALRLLQQHRVDVNILCTVNSRNGERPLEVYRFFRDELDVHYLQFIPIVERDNATGFQEGDTVTDRSVDPAQWGGFLNAIFDEWVRRDVGTTFVINFDGALAGWLGMAGTLCLFGPTCGLAMALEHNGDLYSCDHFVEPRHYLGNIMRKPLADLALGDQQRRFGSAKRDTLPGCCRKCRYLFACHGECPKNRFVTTPDGEPCGNYLCPGYMAFFERADPYMRLMADLLASGRPADGVMTMLERRR
jgi:uncharacterized protein